MKMYKKLLVFLFISCFGVSRAQIVITPKTSAQLGSIIVNDFLAPAPNNGTWWTGNYQYKGAALNSYALFNTPTGNTNNIGILEGILMSTGDVTDVNTNPTPGTISTSTGVTGDANLATLTPNSIEDVSVIEFDFIPKTDTIKFKYAFASEEYTSYTCCPFTDVFGFFITGPKPGGGTYNAQNVAIVPGTVSMPVTIGTINGGAPTGCVGFSTCQSLAYSSLFNWNTGATIAYDGFTDVLEIIIPVVVCETYHLKLAIGDASDPNLDSGVLLLSKSFGGKWLHPTPSNNSIGQDSVWLCKGDSVVLTAPYGHAYSWTGGATTQSITITQPNNYNVMIQNPGAQGCWNLSSTKVLGSDAIAIIDTLGPTSLCAGDSVQLFVANPALNGTYLWSNGATTSSIWIDYTEVGTYTVTVTDRYGLCDSTSSPVTIYPGNGVANVSITAGDTMLCPGQSVSFTANGGPGFMYAWSNGATSQSITTSTAGSYFVTVDNGNCSAISNIFNVTVSSPDSTISPNGPTTFCQPGNVTLSAVPGYTTYQWTGGTTASSLSIIANSSGTYTLTVTDANGCKSTNSQSVTVNSASASINALTDSVICFGVGDSIQLFGNGGTSFAWSGPGGYTSSAQNPWVSAAGNYSVQVTDANGCTAISNQVTIASSTVNPTLTLPTAICIGNNINLNATGGGTYLWSTGATTSTINVAPVTATAYTVTVTNIYGCNQAQGTTIAVNNPSVTINSVDSSFCVGDSAIFTATAGFSNYNWSTGQNGNFQTIAVYNATAVQVTITDNIGCTATSSVINTVVDSIIVDILYAGDNILCPLEQVNLQSSVSSPATYQWSNGSTATNITVGWGTYTMTATNANGCSSSQTVAFTQSLPVANVATATGNSVFCPDSSLELMANGGATVTSWLWSTGETTQSIFVNDDGPYTVTVTNIDNCIADASITISEATPFAVIDTSGPTTFCLGNTVVLTANANLGNTYLWSNGNTTQSITVGGNSGNYNYAVTAFDIYGCPADANIDVTVNQATASIIPGATDTTFCTGDSILLTNTSPNTVSVIWSNGLTTPSIWVDDDGAYSLIVTDVNGCNANSNPINTHLNIPVATITPTSDPVICPGSYVVLNANIATGNTYLWSDGSIGSSVTATSTQTYTVTVTNYLGCVEESDPLTITLSVPSVSIDPGDFAICPNEQATLVANAGSSAAGATYVWQPTLLTGSQLVTALGGGHYVELTDSAGCLATSQTVTVENLPVEANISVSGATEFCRGGTVTITASTQGLGYLWHDLTDPGFTSTDPSITVDDNGKFYVEITNNNGCVGKSDPPTEVYVHEYPVISFTADSTSECDAFKIRFNNYSAFEANSVIAWSFGDSSVSNQFSPIHWYTVNGTYNVILTITSPFGCSSSDSSEIEVVRPPDPIADFTIINNIENNFAGPIAFTNKSKNAVRYHWNFGDNSGSIEENPIHDYREPGYYTVTLTAFNIANCEHQEKAEVTITPIYIPTAFTPNGDGRNDLFPSGLPSNLDVNAYEVTIYNRWGERVFYSNSPNKAWNGDGRDGNPVPGSSYVYEMKIKDRLNKDFVFRGNITIIR